MLCLLFFMRHERWMYWKSKIHIEQLVIELFLTLMVSFDFFPEKYYTTEQQFWVYLIVVTIDCALFLVFVKSGWRQWFPYNVAVVNVQFQLLFNLVWKLQKISVVFLRVDFVFVQWIYQYETGCGFAVSFAVYFQLDFYFAPKIFDLE